MKKILFIFHQKNFCGGASWSLFTLLKYFNLNKNYEITALVPSKGEISKLLEEKNIKYITSPYFNTLLGKDIKDKIKKTLALLFNGILNKILYFKIRQKDYDLVYSNTTAIDIGYYISKKINKKHIIHIREFGKEDYNFDYIYSKNRKKRNQQNIKNTYIVISNELRKKYLEDISSDRLKLVYNGVEDNFFKKKYEKKQIVNFLMIGFIFEGKNQFQVLKAAKLLKDKQVNNFKINFVGKGNLFYTKMLLNYIEKNNLTENINFLGNKNTIEIKKIILQSDVGLMTSLKEAFGRVTVEYMLGGLPVIASNTGANPELIKNDINGYLYSIKSERELADKMEIFIKDFLKVETLGKKARKIGLENYTAKTNYENIKKIIEEQFK